MKLLAVLIPTRKRFDRLVKAIQSVKETTDADNIEIWLRVDRDDTETVEQIPMMLRVEPNLRVLIGDRLDGYASLCCFYQELSYLCYAKWVFIMNDDITVEGNGWDKQLATIPTDGVIVWPEFMQWNNSKYPSGSGYVCPIVPTRCWEKFGVKDLGNPVDMHLIGLLRDQQKWRVELLNGMTVNHQRDSDADLIEFRKQ